MSSPIEKLATLIEREIIDNLRVEFASKFHMTLKEIDTIATFAKNLYVSNREEVLKDARKKK